MCSINVGFCYLFLSALEADPMFTFGYLDKIFLTEKIFDGSKVAVKIFKDFCAKKLVTFIFIIHINS